MKQAYGIAFQRGNDFLDWCYGNGPEGTERLTKDQADRVAIASNNGNKDGPYKAVALPGFVVTPEHESFVDSMLRGLRAFPDNS